VPVPPGRGAGRLDNARRHSLAVTSRCSNGKTAQREWLRPLTHAVPRCRSRPLRAHLMVPKPSTFKCVAVKRSLLPSSHSEGHRTPPSARCSLRAARVHMLRHSRSNTRAAGCEALARATDAIIDIASRPRALCNCHHVDVSSHRRARDTHPVPPWPPCSMLQMDESAGYMRRQSGLSLSSYHRHECTMPSEAPPERAGSDGVESATPPAIRLAVLSRDIPCTPTGWTVVVFVTKTHFYRLRHALPVYE